MLMTFVVFVAYGLIAHGFRRLVADSDRVQSWLRFGFATAFVGLGAKLALSEKWRLLINCGRRNIDLETCMRTHLRRTF